MSPMSGNEDFPLPDDLPEPEDDGSADHVSGMTVPSVALTATNGTVVDLSERTGRTVVYCYPKTGWPDKDVLPDGWNAIRGARGCTPEACSFRDHYQDFQERGVTEVYGLSVQSPAYQREVRNRLHLPFQLLSDEDREFASRLDLPTFEVAGEHLLKRLTLVLNEGRVEYVFYPVFPPDEHATEVLRWLETSPPAGHSE